MHPATRALLEGIPLKESQTEVCASCKAHRRAAPWRVSQNGSFRRNPQTGLVFEEKFRLNKPPRWKALLSEVRSSPGTRVLLKASPSASYGIFAKPPARRGCLSPRPARRMRARAGFRAVGGGVRSELRRNEVTTPARFVRLPGPAEVWERAGRFPRRGLHEMVGAKGATTRPSGDRRGEGLGKNQGAQRPVPKGLSADEGGGRFRRKPRGAQLASGDFQESLPPRRR